MSQTPEEMVQSAIHNAKYGRYGSDPWHGNAEWPKAATGNDDDDPVITESDVEKVLTELVEIITDDFQERLNNLRIT